MNLKRFGVPVVVAITAALALSSCAANEGGAAAAGVGLDALGHPRRRRRVLAGRRTAGLDRRLPDRQPRRHDRLRPLGLRRRPRDLPRGRERLRRLRPRVQGRGDRRRRLRRVRRRHRVVELPLYISPDRGDLQRRGRRRRSTSTPRRIAGIFAGSITNWNDAAIAALNPDATLPDLAITPVHRSDDSGTTENFTDYLGAAAPDGLDLRGRRRLAVPGRRGRTGHLGRRRRRHQRHRHHRLRRRLARRRPRHRRGAGRRRVRRVLARGRCGHRRRSPRVEGRADGDLAIEIDRTTDRGRRLPDRARELPHRLPASTRTPPKVELVKAYFSLHRQRRGPGGRGETAGSAPISDDLARAGRRLRSTRSSSRFVPDPDVSSTDATGVGHGRCPTIHHHLNARITPDDAPRTTAIKAKQRPGDRVFSGSAVFAGSLILVTLAAVALFLDRPEHPRARRDAARTRRSSRQLLGLRRPARLRHRLGRLLALVIAMPARDRHRALHLALRAAPARRRASATSSTCSPPCPPSSSASGASACSPRRSSRSTPGSSTTSAGSRSSPAPVSGTGRTILTAAIVLAVMVAADHHRDLPRGLPADAGAPRGGRARPRRHPLGDDPHRGAALRPPGHHLRRRCSASAARSARRWPSPWCSPPAGAVTFQLLTSVNPSTIAANIALSSPRPTA